MWKSLIKFLLHMILTTINIMNFMINYVYLANY